MAATPTSSDDDIEFDEMKGTIMHEVTSIACLLFVNEMNWCMISSNDAIINRYKLTSTEIAHLRTFVQSNVFDKWKNSLLRLVDAQFIDPTNVHGPISDKLNEKAKMKFLAVIAKPLHIETLCDLIFTSYETDKNIKKHETNTDACNIDPNGNIYHKGYQFTSIDFVNYFSEKLSACPKVNNKKDHQMAVTMVAKSVVSSIFALLSVFMLDSNDIYATNVGENISNANTSYEKHTTEFTKDVNILLNRLSLSNDEKGRILQFIKEIWIPKTTGIAETSYNMAWFYGQKTTCGIARGLLKGAIGTITTSGNVMQFVKNTSTNALGAGVSGVSNTASFCAGIVSTGANEVYFGMGSAMVAGATAIESAGSSLASATSATLGTLSNITSGTISGIYNLASLGLNTAEGVIGFAYPMVGFTWNVLKSFISNLFTIIYKWVSIIWNNSIQLAYSLCHTIIKVLSIFVSAIASSITYVINGIIDAFVRLLGMIKAKIKKTIRDWAQITVIATSDASSGARIARYGVSDVTDFTELACYIFCYVTAVVKQNSSLPQSSDLSNFIENIGDNFTRNAIDEHDMSVFYFHFDPKKDSKCLLARKHFHGMMLCLEQALYTVTKVDRRDVEESNIAMESKTRFLNVVTGQNAQDVADIQNIAIKLLKLTQFMPVLDPEHPHAYYKCIHHFLSKVKINGKTFLFRYDSSGAPIDEDAQTFVQHVSKEETKTDEVSVGKVLLQLHKDLIEECSDEVGNDSSGSNPFFHIPPKSHYAKLYAVLEEIMIIRSGAMSFVVDELKLILGFIDSGNTDDKYHLGQFYTPIIHENFTQEARLTTNFWKSLKFSAGNGGPLAPLHFHISFDVNGEFQYLKNGDTYSVFKTILNFWHFSKLATENPLNILKYITERVIHAIEKSLDYPLVKEFLNNETHAEQARVFISTRCVHGREETSKGLTLYHNKKRDFGLNDVRTEAVEFCNSVLQSLLAKVHMVLYNMANMETINDQIKLHSPATHIINFHVSCQNNNTPVRRQTTLPKNFPMNDFQAIISKAANLNALILDMKLIDAEINDQTLFSNDRKIVIERSQFLSEIAHLHIVEIQKNLFPTNMNKKTMIESMAVCNILNLLCDKKRLPKHTNDQTLLFFFIYTQALHYLINGYMIHYSPIYTYFVAILNKYEKDSPSTLQKTMDADVFFLMLFQHMTKLNATNLLEVSREAINKAQQEIIVQAESESQINPVNGDTF